ncbi:hypothetical protein GXW82_14690 [Streptacidiphilus sp. 4-A2]|nr:hypothetical protein [Streptacidiphilus sp. 4-A2]
MYPKLKNVVWERSDDEVRIVVAEPMEEIELSDETGLLETFLTLLGDGTRTVGELANALCDRTGSEISSEDVLESLETLDGLGLLVDASPGVLTGPQLERYASNLAFFGNYCTLADRPADFQRALLDSHVVFLGSVARLPGSSRSPAPGWAA